MANSLLIPFVTASLLSVPPPAEQNWCTVGRTVMVPDGREATVTSTQGDICRVLAFGEGYVSLIPYYLVEPVYPQNIPERNIGH